MESALQNAHRSREMDVNRASMVAGLSAAVLVVIAGCSTTDATAPSETATTSAVPSSGSLEDSARAAAERIAGDADLSGTTVTILGALGGEQLDQYMAMFAPLEDATGIKVSYEGTRDMLSVLETRVQGNNAPDIVSNPSIGQMRQLIEDGSLLPLSDFLDMDQVGQDYDEGLLELGSQDGTLYGLMETAALKGLVYYNPLTYTGPTDAESWSSLDDWASGEAAAGSPPWCLGVESGAASGWLATDWIEQFVLTGAGPDVWDEWVAGDLSWTSPEIKTAFEEFGAVATDPTMVNGGPVAVTSTDFITGALPLWSDPPRCSLTLQADWLGATVVSQVPGTAEGESVSFFMFPPVDTEHAGYIEAAGEMIGAFNDRPEVRVTMEYLAAAESQAILASSGSWLAPNKAVPLEAYPTEARRQAAAILAGASGVRFDASDLMPQAVNEAFWAATLTYISDPTKLDEALESIEQARLANQ